MLWAEAFTIERASTMHRHDLEELVIGLEGQGRQCSGRQVDPITVDDCIFVSGDRHHQLLVDRGPLRVGVICFDRERFGPHLRSLIDGLRRRGQVALPPSDWARGFVRQRWQTLIAEVRRKLVFAEEKVAAATIELLVELHRASSGSERCGSDPRSASITTVADRIAADPTQAWNLTWAADQARMSRATFTRHFRRVIGRSFVDYLHGLRLELACGLLRHRGDLGVAAVALQAGFGNLAAFHRLFRRTYATSPASYRRRLTHEGPFAQILHEELCAPPG